MSRTYPINQLGKIAFTGFMLMMFTPIAHAQITLHRQSFLFNSGQPIKLMLQCKQAEASTNDAQFVCLLTPYGKTNTTTTQHSISNLTTAAHAYELELPSQAEGLYNLQIQLIVKGKQVSEKTISIGVLPQAQAKAVKPESAFGTVAHLNRMKPDELRATVKNMSRIGIRWAREGFIWSDIQPTPDGPMQWEHYDQMIDTCEEFGITVLPVLAYSTKWAAQYPPKDINSKNQRSEAMPRLDAWQNFARASVERYKDRIKHWEIWNEPNSTTFMKVADRTKQAQDYAQLLATAHQTIKQHDPKAQIIIGGFTPKHWLPKVPYLHEANFMKAIYAHQPRPFDILGYHPYTAPHTDTTNAATVKKYFKLASFCWDVSMEKKGQLPATWMTEFGTPTMPFMTEDRAAQYMAVLYVTAMADGRVAKNFWYDFQNDGPKSDNKEHNFGLLRFDGTPKPGYFAYRNLTSMLEDAQFQSSTDHGQWIEHRFTRAGKNFSVIWCHEDSQLTIALPVKASSCEVINVIGQSQRIETSKGQLQLMITQSPLFVLQ